MARLLLLLPTSTYRAPDFVAAARAEGVEVVVGSDRRQALAPEMGDRAVVVNLRDPERGVSAIAELHARAPLDGIVAVDDQGVIVAARAAARLGLAHNPVAAVEATRDKAAMRRALAAAGVPQPAFALVGEAPRVGSPGGVAFPVVVKPRHLSGSRGVIRVDDRAQAQAAFARVRRMLGDDEGGADLLVEEFIAGPEVAVEGLLRGGHLEVVAIFDKPDPLDGPYFEETIYVTPSRLSDANRAGVEAVTAQACRAIGLVEGPVHAEIRLSMGGPRVIEVAARSIGGLCSRALRFGAGVSLEQLIVRHALGRPVDDIRRERRASGVMMLPIPTSGVLEGVAGLEAARQVPGIQDVVITVPTGHRVVTLPEGDRYLGFAFARAGDPAAVEAALRAAHTALVIRVRPDEGS